MSERYFVYWQIVTLCNYLISVIGHKFGESLIGLFNDFFAAGGSVDSRIDFL